MPQDRFKLTKASVEGLPIPLDGYTILRDSELRGFGVRVTSGGVKSYFVERMTDGRNVRSTIGRHGEITAAEARTKAEKLLAQMRDGFDPVLAKKAAISARQSKEITFGSVAEAYVSERERVRLKASTAKSYRDDLSIRLATIRDEPIERIDRKVIADLHAALSEKGPTVANRVMRFARAVFNYALENEDYQRPNGEQIVTSNPVGVLRSRRLWNPSRRKHDYVPPEKLGAFIEAVLSIAPLRWCETHANGQRRSDTVILYLLLLTCFGFRTGEASHIRRVDWSSDTREIRISDPKNINSAGRDFTIPAGWRMSALIERQLSTYRGDWLLMNEAGDGPLPDPRAIRADVSERSGVAFTAHDLRRTFASLLNALTPAPSQYQIKRLMNHTPDKDVTTEYIQHDREDLRSIIQRVEDQVFGSIASARPMARIIFG